jgi:hypothetical protein
MLRGRDDGFTADHGTQVLRSVRGVRSTDHA